MTVPGSDGPTTATLHDDGPPAAATVDAPITSRARQRGIGIVELLASALMLWAFALGSTAGQKARFVLAADGVDAPALVLPVRTSATVLAIVCAVLGAIQLTRGFGRRTLLVLGIVAGLFVVALLAWAAAGQAFNFTGMIQVAVQRATPLALGALAGLLCEKAGVVNIAIEGMMLMAAFTACLVASAASAAAFGLPLGLLAGVATGALFGAVLAVLSIRFKVDQIVGGTGINIFALGMTGYLYDQIFLKYQNLNNSGTIDKIKIPLLGQIPVIGPALFNHSPFVYAAAVLVAVLAYVYANTRWGLRVRAVGEHPKAADTIGIDVRRTRFWCVVLGGMCAGLAGSYLSIGALGQFDENMTAGRGFIALAALIFGRWRPTGALLAALLFGFAESLRLRLGGLGTPIPSDLLQLAPYILTLVAVAGLVGRSRAPAADGVPY